LLSEESEPLKCESWATCNLPSGNSADPSLIPSPSKIPSQINLDNTFAPSVGQEPSSEQPTQEPLQLCQLSRRRPLLHVTIPETQRVIPWLDRHLCDSPLVCITELLNCLVFTDISLSRGSAWTFHCPQFFSMQMPYARILMVYTTCTLSYLTMSSPKRPILNLHDNNLSRINR
jgi:hypothetical protein